MAGLSVKGDPDGWLDAGRTISTLMTQLDSELCDANTVGGAELARSWSGPAASAFAADWNTRRSRYEDLIYNARRAAQAITEYGEQLLGMAQQAAYLESYWCGFGLHILATGEDFMLPPGLASMPPGTQLSLHQALSESKTAVERLASDALGAAEDLAVALGSVIAALEDFQLIEVGALAAVGGAAGGYLVSDFKDPVNDLHEGLDLGYGYLKQARDSAGEATDNARMFAAQMSSYLREGTSGERSVAGKLLPGAGRDAEAASATAGGLDLLTKGTLVVANAVVAVQVISGARHEGLQASLEENSGGVASTLTTDAIIGAAIAFPEVDLGVVAGGLIAVGVGFTVQEIVDHRQAIGHFIESAF